jgi:tetraacyldisaccharide 4'-kinase
MIRARDVARRLWDGELGAAGALLDVALAPAEVLYRLGVGIRGATYDRGIARQFSAAVPVISVGNVAVGGTGKTPVSHWVALRLKSQGRRPAILHGGYAADEPELHRRWSPDVPVVVRRDRVAGAALALALGAGVLVMDDGFQHRRLRRELDIVLVAAERWTATPRLLPRGPWREPPSALRRAGVVVVTRKTAPAEVAARVAGEVRSMAGVEVACMHLSPTGWLDGGTGEPAVAPSEPVVVVCGVAEPELFRVNVAQAGADVAQLLAFPDHHTYDRRDVERIREAAGRRWVVTTEKDWVKLEPLLEGVPVRLLVQEVVVEEGGPMLDRRLRDAVA